jgi:lipopolysaccharide/colanic/teichoic acid biosynthesis glycosyltransferase
MSGVEPETPDQAPPRQVPGEAKVSQQGYPHAVSGPRLGEEETRLYAVPVVMEQRAGPWLLEQAYRIFEIVFAAIALVASLPVMLVEAIIIRLDSPGPVFFQQPRTARSTIMPGRELANRPDLRPQDGTEFEPDMLYYVPARFKLTKFRTMFDDARIRFPELYTYYFAPGKFIKSPFKQDNDPRVTRAGRVLRRLTIDELPNFWSVIKGDMRLVGPRPELPYLLRYYTPEQMYKFSVKPGVTGLAQIRGRGLLTHGETIGYDLEYVANRSVSMDLKILFVTIGLVLTRRGAF